MYSPPCIKIFVLLLIFLSFTVQADNWWENGSSNNNSQEQDAPQKNKKRRIRKPSDNQESSLGSDPLESEESAQTPLTKRSRLTRKRTKKMQLNLDLFAGFSPAKIIDPTGVTTPSGGSIYHYGLNGDLKFKHFGVEIEGSGSSGTGTAVLVSDPKSSSTVSFQQIGVMGALKGHYALTVKKIKWIAKLGAGYGLISATQSQATTSVVSGSLKNSLSGIFFVIGIDALVLPWMNLSADYALSITASGSSSITGSPLVTAASGASFQRIRIGATFRVARRFTLGAHYMLRSMSYGLNSPSESHNQVLGSVGVIF